MRSMETKSFRNSREKSQSRNSFEKLFSFLLHVLEKVDNAVSKSFPGWGNENY